LNLAFVFTSSPLSNLSIFFFFPTGFEKIGGEWRPKSVKTLSLADRTTTIVLKKICLAVTDKNLEKAAVVSDLFPSREVTHLNNSKAKYYTPSSSAARPFVVPYKQLIENLAPNVVLCAGDWAWRLLNIDNLQLVAQDAGVRLFQDVKGRRYIASRVHVSFLGDTRAPEEDRLDYCASLANILAQAFGKSADDVYEAISVCVTNTPYRKSNSVNWVAWYDSRTQFQFEVRL
jgi:hypothetical protein